LSRFVEDYLETTGEEFELNVSSAGADHPFSLTRQYKKYIGRDISVLLNDDKKITGQLLSLKENGIDILPQVKKSKKDEEQHTGPIFISFQEIKEAKPLISFK
jgi:ribosome maturation factor RimP